MNLDKILKAAEQGNVTAATLLGLYYLDGGTGVTVDGFDAQDDDSAVDYDKAHHWLFIASELGSPRAQVNLAIIYRDGLGRDTDSDQALAWLNKAAIKHDILAHVLLARHYADSADVVQAKHHYEEIISLQTQSEAPISTPELEEAKQYVAKHTN